MPLTDTAGPLGIGISPLGRQARLNDIAELLRGENWDVTGSLTRAVTSEASGSGQPSSVEVSGSGQQVEDDDGEAD